MGENRTPVDHDELGSLAVVGLAFEFAQGTTSADSFWDMICEGRSASSEFPTDRMNIENFYHPDSSRPGTFNVRGGNFIKEPLGAFDAPFFAITPAEAACMDPQHRRMLETAYHALESAGITMEQCSGSKTSVYTGCFTNDYHSILQQDPELEQTHAAAGISPAMLANRISWFFNFKGTSLNLDSACSSSLLALHLACQDLRSGGANLVFHPDFMNIMSLFKFFSADSQCWSFDDRANGYSRGEGIAVIVLKTVKEALRNGDTIRAVIRNTASNQDGRTPSITQPSPQAQVDLIKQTYEEARIPMGPTRFFEAHGTGTAVGDPIEANAIGYAFRDSRSADDPVFVGAVKANIGHLEGASGLAGLIKTVLVLEHGVIPPIAKLKSLNLQINPDELRLHFPTKAIPWPSVGLRRACVNSFGFGGTNAVAILDDAYHYLKLNGIRGLHQTCADPSLFSSDSVNTAITNTSHIDFNSDNLAPKTDINSYPPVKERPRLLVWSAADIVAARSLAIVARDYDMEGPFELDDLAYTLSRKRTQFQWRLFRVLYPGSSAHVEGSTVSAPTKVHANHQVAFVFTGQGSEYSCMGRGLSHLPVFRDSIRLLEKCLKELNCPWSLSSMLESDMEDVPINSPEYSQALTTSLQMALVDTLRALGVFPTVVLGHSSGEICAAYAAGGISRSSAVKVAYFRGMLSAQLAKRKVGLSMMAVGISRHDVADYFSRLKEFDNTLRVGIACVNSPRSITLSGETRQLKILEQLFQESNVFVRRLKMPIAYHSNMMGEIADEYRVAIGDLEAGNRSNIIPMVSSVNGAIMTGNILQTADYWVNNLVSTVEFDAALSKVFSLTFTRPEKPSRNGMLDNSISHLLEIGPHSTLKAPINEILRQSTMVEKPRYISLLDRKEDSFFSLLSALGRLYCEGFPVDVLAANAIGRTPRQCPPNMVKYPFNHTQSYWKESRLSQNFRFRETPRHDLLGTRSLDWNPQLAQWRNVMRLRDLSWASDHRIGDEIVLPAAAMVVMAVEALRQVLGSPTGLTGIHLHDVDFMHAMKFPPVRPEIETQFTLSTESRSPDISTWWQFRLFAIENGHYIECCRGSVQGVHFNQENMIYHIPGMSREAVQGWMNDINRSAKAPRDPYDTSGTAVQYGPCFQNLENMRVGPEGEATAMLKMDTWATNTESDQWAQEYAMHPCVIDGLAQVIFPTLTAWQSLSTMVAARANDIWISFPCLASPKLDTLQVLAKCKMQGPRGATADLLATTIGSSDPVLSMQGLQTTLVGTALENEGPPRDLCTKLIWKPDTDLINHEQLRDEMCRDRPKEPVDTTRKCELLELAILCFLEEAVSFLESNRSVSVPNYLQQYVTWMKHQLQLRHTEASQAEASRLLSDLEARKELELRVQTAGQDGQFYMQVGHNLLSILSGDAEVLDVMFESGLFDQFYETVLANAHDSHPISALVEHLCFKNPTMRIIEIGAGTGGQTVGTLKALCSNDVKKCARYDYTDISRAFFPRARTKFAKYDDILDYSVCDISKDPVSQSFEPFSYDLVIASHVLHATPILEQTLQNTRRLLKPGGKLILLETTNVDAIDVGFVFGLLQSWWAPLESEPRSPLSPCITVDQWNKLLKSTGFSGVDIEVPGQENARRRYSSIMISTAVPEQDRLAEPSHDLYLVRNGNIAAQNELVQSVQNEQVSSIYTLAEMADVEIPTSTVVVFLLEVRDVLLDGISPQDFELLQSVLLRTHSTLWITQPTEDEQIPRQHMVDGLARSLGSEDSNRKLVTLALNQSNTVRRSTEYILQLITNIQRSTVESLETNYAVKNDLLCVPRITLDRLMSESIALNAQPHVKENQTLDPDTHVFLRVRSPGGIDNLEYVEDTLTQLDLGPNEVIVQVKAFGLTFRDHLIATGELNEYGLGTECAGVVFKAGTDVQFQPGDRVCAIGLSMARSVIRVTAGAIAPIPSRVSFATASSLPTALWLAYYTLCTVARLDESETVLVHGFGSSFSQVAIQLAVKLGARVLVTTRSVSKRDLLCQKLDISQNIIFVSDDSSTCGRIHAITKGQGVDVVVGSLSDKNTPDYSEWLAAGGRVVDTSLKKSDKASIPQLKNRGVNCSYSSVNLAELLRHNPALVYRSFQQAVKLWYQLSLNYPLPLNSFSAAEVDSALQHFRDRESVGKRVIELTDGETIEVTCASRPKYYFESRASYIIAGGLGGLGRSSARWMASRGVRHLILLSRSGPKTTAARELVNDLKSQGVSVVTPKVDISDFKSVKKVLDDLSQAMPPIRGCIQATLDLRDGLFSNMQYDDWITPLKAKVAGSWNLHKALPSDLDFMILSSSVNGVFGSPGQANYAAGNTFNDALAEHRLRNGQKAVSLDLGSLITEGVVAESPVIMAFVRRFGHLMEITHEELLTILDHYCNPDLPTLTPDQAQAIVGIKLPAEMIANGFELHHFMRRPLFSHLFRVQLRGAETDSSAGAGATAGTIDRPAALKLVTSSKDAMQLVTEWTCTKLSLILGVPVSELDLTKPVHTYGVDSLVAIDLRNWFNREIGASIDVFDLTGNMALEQLIAMAVRRSQFCQAIVD
ncbi:putative polyketide synthase [Aspergillus affinis]|uniref:putative polyketide synthase n=1 Tax=Aspergillus affinis TaxID=1070780 RepID=UPI0022FE9783|nr:putative polyketide synthase [Aspergillus affinis]KAI9035970.1 putative polyketide synthase [Aspergillus affinis]